MRASKFSAEVHRRILRRADPKVKEGAERYFKYQVRFLGLSTPGLRALAREVDPLLANRPFPAQIAECFRLLHSSWAEEKQIGIVLLSRRVKRLPPGFLRQLEPVFDRTIRDWATCDHIAGSILRPLLNASPAARRTVVSWRGATSPWRQRAAAVAFVNDAKRGIYNREILLICRTLVRNRDRFVQLGMGWVLRELYLADAKAVLAFLRKNYGRINREALRYAIEKMPPRLQSTLLLEHQPSRSTS